MSQEIIVKRNEVIHLIVEGETKVGIRINSKGHPEVIWKRDYNKKPIKALEYPSVSIPSWMRK